MIDYVAMITDEIYKHYINILISVIWKKEKPKHLHQNSCTTLCLVYMLIHTADPEIYNDKRSYICFHVFFGICW